MALDVLQGDGAKGKLESGNHLINFSSAIPLFDFINVEHLNSRNFLTTRLPSITAWPPNGRGAQAQPAVPLLRRPPSCALAGSEKPSTDLRQSLHRRGNSGRRRQGLKSALIRHCWLR